MQLEELKIKSRKDLNNAICLMGVIPTLVFVYLLVSKTKSFDVFLGETGYTIATALTVFLTGIITGRRMLRALLKKLINFNEEIVRMQNELIEKNRLIAVTETVLALSHEINNPLMVMRGNLDLMEEDFSKYNVEVSAKERLSKIKSYCERIRQVTDKMAHLSKPATETVHGDVKMIDLSKSE